MDLGQLKAEACDGQICFDRIGAGVERWYRELPNVSHEDNTDSAKLVVACRAAAPTANHRLWRQVFLVDRMALYYPRLNRPGLVFHSCEARDLVRLCGALPTMVAHVCPQSPALTGVRRCEALHLVVENSVAVAVDRGVGNESIHEINTSAGSGSSSTRILRSRDAITSTGQDASGASAKSHHPAGIPFDDGVMNSWPEHNANLAAGANNVVRNTTKGCAKIYLQPPRGWGPWDT